MPAEETAAAPAAPPAEGVPEGTASPAAATPRGFRFLGEDKSVHTALGGGRNLLRLPFLTDVDELLRNSTGACLYEAAYGPISGHRRALRARTPPPPPAAPAAEHRRGTDATPPSCFASPPSARSPPDIPEVQISEELAANIARALRTDINQALGLLRDFALGHDLMKFLGVMVALWILAEIGGLCDFLTLIYAAALMLHTVPILYHKYQDKVDHFAGKAHIELRKQYKVLDAKVLSKIPRGPARATKQD